MVVEIDSAGPGDESWRSTRFTAKINTTESFVYGHTETVDMDTIVWDSGDSVEHSWIKYGADEEVTLVVSKADGTAISSATVYPKNTKFTQRISYGSLYLTILPNTNLYVEINGDRKQTLSIIGQRPKPKLLTTHTEWTTRELSVTNVDTTLNLLTVPNHGIPSGGVARVAINSSGTMPAVSQGLCEANHELVAAHISDSVIALVDREATQVLFSSAGTGDITLSLMDHLTGGTLYFPTGVHHIGRGFRVESGTTLYFEQGAVVVGSLDLRRFDSSGAVVSSSAGMTQDVSLVGPGMLSGTYIRRADIDQSAGQYISLENYAAIEGRIYYGDNVRAPTTNRIEGVTVFKHAFYLNHSGIGDFNQCSYISPWTYNADGPRPVSRAEAEFGYIRDCFIFGGDDSLKLFDTSGGPLYCSGCLVVQTGNAAIHFGARPANWQKDLFAVKVDDVDVLYLSVADTGVEQNSSGNAPSPALGSRCVIKALTDGFDGDPTPEEDQSAMGFRHAMLTNIRVWDTACQGRPIALGNLRYPFGGPANTPSQRDQHGTAGFFIFDNIWFEGSPSNKSGLYDHDENNAANNVTIRNMVLGGVKVTSENKDTFWDVDPYVYNVTFDPPQVTDPYSGGQ